MNYAISAARANGAGTFFPDSDFVSGFSPAAFHSTTGRMSFTEPTGGVARTMPGVVRPDNAASGRIGGSVGGATLRSSIAVPSKVLQFPRSSEVSVEKVLDLVLGRSILGTNYDGLSPRDLGAEIYQSDTDWNMFILRHSESAEVLGQLSLATRIYLKYYNTLLKTEAHTNLLPHLMLSSTDIKDSLSRMLLQAVLVSRLAPGFHLLNNPKKQIATATDALLRDLGYRRGFFSSIEVTLSPEEIVKLILSGELKFGSALQYDVWGRILEGNKPFTSQPTVWQKIKSGFRSLFSASN